MKVQQMINILQNLAISSLNRSSRMYVLLFCIQLWLLSMANCMFLNNDPCDVNMWDKRQVIANNY